MFDVCGDDLGLARDVSRPTLTSRFSLGPTLAGRIRGLSACQSHAPSPPWSRGRSVGGDYSVAREKYSMERGWASVESFLATIT